MAPSGREQSTRSGDAVSRRWLLWTALGGALLLTVACRDMQFSPDSIHYTDVARTLLREHTAATYHLTLNSRSVPDPRLYWPPGYPLALAIVMAAGASVQTAAWVVAVVSWSAALLLLVFWLRRPEWGIAGAVSFIFLIFVCGVAFRAWSEGPYTALMLGALVCMAAALAADAPRRAAWLGLAAGVLTAGAALCRYPGIVIIAALGLTAAAAPRNDENTGPIRRSAGAVMLGAAVLIICAWIARNIALTGAPFGPARPPGERSLLEIFAALGQSVYLDFGAVLLALLFATVGYHTFPQRSAADGPDAQRRTFLRTLALAALLSAAAQLALVLLTYILWQVDEPPTKRYFLPAYICTLTAGLALIAMTRPPDDVLRRRWPLVVLLAGPLLLGPTVAAMMSHDVTPQRTAVENWIEANTSPDTLIIGHRIWPVRFYTDRPVLQSGQVADPSVYDGFRVAAFLHRFGARFDDAYLLLPDLIPAQQRREIIAGYRQAGLAPQPVADIPTRTYDGAREFIMQVYRVRGGFGNATPGE